MFVSGESPRRVGHSECGASLFGPDMALDIGTLLEKLPEKQRDQEFKQVSMTDENAYLSSLPLTSHNCQQAFRSIQRDYHQLTMTEQICGGVLFNDT